MNDEKGNNRRHAEEMHDGRKSQWTAILEHPAYCTSEQWSNVR